MSVPRRVLAGGKVAIVTGGGIGHEVVLATERQAEHALWALPLSFMPLNTSGPL